VNPTQNIRVGMTGTETTVVTHELTVAHFHPEMPEVYGTPFMIYLMEVAASNAIQEHLPQGWVSVGTAVNVKHLAATPVGRSVTAKAVVTAVTDRMIEFAVEADDGSETIGSGTHARVAVDLARFNERMQKKR
jgi:predicted thioesterase